MMQSALYAGHVAHTRLRPRKHKLNYRVFSLLLDLDEVASLDKGLRLFGVNRSATFSFHERDHGDGGTNLRAWVETQMTAAGIAVDHPSIRVLCYPRIWGYVFNPLTVYFCRDVEGTLLAILYEVCNTFGERRTYVMRPESDSEVVEQSCEKELYVSPFMPMNCTYNFHIEPPAEKVLVRIDETDPEGLLLRASFAGQREPMTDATLLRALLRYPLMTLKVTAAIHWEALKLVLKGVPVIRHKKAAERITTTIVAAKP